eukprot:299623-Pleurochrysis_carterae.AAC.2
MAEGCESLPDGLAAWLPSVCLIRSPCHLEARASAAPLSADVASLENSSAPAASASAATAQRGERRGDGYQTERDSDDEGGQEFVD